MKGLTVQQPWAWAIFHGKAVENRTALWSYRGALAIHAGRRWSQRGEACELVMQAWRRAGGALLEELPMGVIVGVVELVDCHPDAGCCKPWGESSYVEHGGRERRAITHLVFENPRELARPVPCVGALGLWSLPADIAGQLEER